MAKQVRNSDIFSADLFKKTQEDVKLLITEIDSLEASLIKVATTQKKILNTQDNKSIESIQRTKQATEKLNATEEVATKLRKQKITLEQKLNQAKTTSAKQDALTRVELQEQNKLNKQLAREKLGLVGAYSKEAKTLIELRKRYKDLAVAEKQTTKEGRLLLSQITALDSKLKKVDKTVGQSQRNVGNYGSAFGRAGNALRGFAGALGITAGLTGLVRVMTNSIAKAREFEQGNANLSAILGKTREEITNLTKDAKRLGAETSFSATQVSQLQTEFAKLGFNEKEILNATESTLNLASATGSDLAEASAIAGATLGGFGLDASETARVTDVMAKSFSSSALDMEKFKEAMKESAPASKAVGIEIEQTTALLGTLANAGISGSKAGTALKAGFIELNAEGISLDKALEKITKSEDKLATATALVGKRSATSFLVLADGVKTTKALEKELRNAGGTAELMAKKQLATLDGRIKILSSAWEGLVLNTLSGDSAFSTVASTVTDLATNMVGFLTVTESLSDELEAQADSLLSLTVSLNDVNTNTSTRLDIMQDLNRNYPALLKNLGFEKVGLDNVNEAVSALNKNLTERANVQKAVEETTGANNLKNRVAEARQKSINKFIFEGTKNLQENGKANLLVNKTIDEQIKIIEENQTFWQGISNEIGNVENQTFLLNSTTKENSEALAENKKFIEGILKSKKDLENLTTEELRALVKSNILRGEDLQLQAKEIIILRERKAVTEEETEVINENTEAKGNNAKKTRELTGLIEKQEKAIKDLQKELKRAKTEENILKISIEIDVAQDELNRLKRIVSSTFKEIDKIERDLIEDATERRIAQEIAKSEKLIQQIEDNSRIETSVKERLIAEENKRLAKFVNDAEIEKGKQAIKDAEALSKAEFEQRRTGFKTQEAFEEEKAKQFQAIKKKALEDELKLLEQFGGEETKVRQEQIKAQLQGFDELGKGAKELGDALGSAIEVIGDLVDEAFEKKLEAIDKAIGKTGERIDNLTDKANRGSLSAQESLAVERKREAELEKERAKERKRQEQAQAFFAVLTAFNQNDGNIGKTISDVTILKSLAGQLTAFDGVDDTGGRGTVDSKGGKIWTLHPNEQVWSKKDRSEVGFRSREELKNIVGMYDNGMFSDLMRHDRSNELTPLSLKLNGLSGNGEVVRGLQTLNKSVQGIDIPEGMVHIDEVRKLITLHSRKGNKKTKEVSKLFNR